MKLPEIIEELNFIESRLRTVRNMLNEGYPAAVDAHVYQAEQAVARIKKILEIN